MTARKVAKRVYGWQQTMRGRASLATRQVTGFIGRAGRSSHPVRPPACVLGDVDLVRALGLARISSTVLAPPGAPVRYSRHTRAVFPWHNAWETPEALVDSLVRFGQAQPEQVDPEPAQAGLVRAAQRDLLQAQDAEGPRRAGRV